MLTYEKKFNNNSSKLIEKKNNYNICELYKKDYKNNIFVIVTNKNMEYCGFFCYYNIYISCIQPFIIKGYIPIIDLYSFPNVLNRFKANSTINNPWEYFFNQPLCYSLKDVKKYAKNYSYYQCKNIIDRPQFRDFYNKSLSFFLWHDIAKNYIPIKNEIIKESNIIIKNLFHGSNNILGILIRGTDYLAFKPKNHPITPDPDRVINDIKKMNKRNNYNWFFITTEDYIIRKKFIIEFGDKIKYLLPKKEIEYNDENKMYLSFHKDIKGNLENMKIYLINIIILSKCLDIITSRTNGSAAAFIFKDGLFRKKIIYFLGIYQ